MSRCRNVDVAKLKRCRVHSLGVLVDDVGKWLQFTDDQIDVLIFCNILVLNEGINIEMMKLAFILVLATFIVQYLKYVFM